MVMMIIFTYSTTNLSSFSQQFQQLESFFMVKGSKTISFFYQSSTVSKPSLKTYNLYYSWTIHLLIHPLYKNPTGISFALQLKKRAMGHKSRHIDCCMSQFFSKYRTVIWLSRSPFKWLCLVCFCQHSGRVLAQLAIGLFVSLIPNLIKLPSTHTTLF